MAWIDFYVKDSLGKDKQPIKVYKLRTMRVGADADLDYLTNAEFDSFGKPLDDPRITTSGKFLRALWFDELPQLYNLYKGDIKLVGIRPMNALKWKRYPSELMERALQQKHGLLGVQYAYPYTKNFEHHLLYLTEYLDKWEENPIKTDEEYRSIILRKILFDGVRSS